MGTSGIILVDLVPLAHVPHGPLGIKEGNRELVAILILFNEAGGLVG